MTKTTCAFSMLLTAAATLLGCGGPQPTDTAATPETAEQVNETQARATSFLDQYLTEYAGKEFAQTMGYWTAANSGKKEDFDAFAAADLELKKLHSDSARYAEITELLGLRDQLDPLSARSLELAELAFKENQLPEEMLAKLVTKSTEIEQIFSTFRGEIAGKPYSNNELLEMLARETKSKKREKIWQALKQVGGAVGPKLVELAKVRNEAATKLGYSSYWEMKVRLQEYDPEQLLAIFAELEQLTDAPFREMKATLDDELGRRFKLKPAKMMPWHYDNPFFQAAPPSEKINLDEFYKNKVKEDIVEIARRFFSDIGIDINGIVERSDLYEREGKDQHAFCIAINREGDVRTLLNIKPTAEWMGTMLHEQGHAVFYEGLDMTLPFNLREAAHIFTTEAAAMLFGALASNPTWLVAYAGADQARVTEMESAILEQRRREQLIFARWTMVMLYFEKDLYENPDQDLNKLWWDYVERFQLLKRPPNRSEADWAAKPHFTIAPVYYHNYMLGELFAAQLRSTLAKMSGHEGSTTTLSFNNQKEFGDFLKEKVFRPGMRTPWAAMVEEATGENLTAKHFAAELK